ncbi:uncharacterized protein DSM5745_00065 [Aspergillus mulundensis]|uniref:F-box domain-containing protein n=1 Tax=Aspergillus mulundensis TaxID=1810919 RepID=A0A3D8T2G7_9EURO|nr:hypothetical protein DSM5745_00065 [Aspergillus mulundensis]RDW92743.1 hypothetical protein DSM5745_00065 [Aspergillus mulundensis]
MSSQSIAQYMISRPNLPPHPRTLKHLLTLPPALLNRILSFLPPAALAVLLRVNRYLNATATPLLYRRVIIHPDLGVDAATMQFIRDPSRTFVYALSRHYEPVRLVQELVVHQHYAFYMPFADALDRMIAQMRNLERLVIKACYATTPLLSEEPGLAGPLRAQIGGVFSRWASSLLMGKLESCEISLSFDVPWNFTEYTALLTHHTLKRLTIHNASIHDFHTRMNTHSTRLQSLTLLCCDITPTALLKILTLPRALTHLSLTGPRQIGGAVHTSSQHALYLAALEPQQNSLKSFEWTLSRLRIANVTPLDFSHLSSLETLTFTPFLIRARGTLQNLTPLASPCPFPSSLKELRILHIWSGTVVEAERMVMVVVGHLSRNGQMGNLERVVFDTPRAPWFRREYPLPALPTLGLPGGEGPETQTGTHDDGEDAASTSSLSEGLDTDPDPAQTQEEREEAGGDTETKPSLRIERTRCQLGRSFAADDLGECPCCDYDLGRTVVFEVNGRGGGNGTPNATP